VGSEQLTEQGMKTSAPAEQQHETKIQGNQCLILTFLVHFLTVASFVTQTELMLSISLTSAMLHQEWI